MPGDSLFLAPDLLGRDKPGVRLGPRRLTIWHGRRRRSIAWPEILAVRWRGPAEAELELLDGGRLLLPLLADLAAAVERIDQEVARVRAAAHRATEPPRDIVESLLWRERRGRLLARLGLWLCGLAYLVVGIPGDAELPVVSNWRLVGVLCLIAVAAVLVRPARRGHALDSEGIWTKSRRVAWRDLMFVGASPSQMPVGRRTVTVRLHTVHGDVFFEGYAADVAQIRQYLRLRQAWRATAYAPAGSAPPSDNALSLARLSEEPGAERGLSQLRSGADE